LKSVTNLVLGVITPDDARELLNVWLVQQFFPQLRGTRIIPSHLGEHGCGKTTAGELIGRLVVGPNFKPIGVKKEGERNWVAAVTNRTIIVFDNADASIPWMPDELARYATGQRYDCAALYKNNELLSFLPTASIILTSRDPKFNREDVAERLLPIYFERPEGGNYIAEKEIENAIDEMRNKIWGELLTTMAAFVENLDLNEKLSVRFRMADYGTFGLRWTTNREAWTKRLAKLARAQGEFATKDDAVTQVLRAMLVKYGTLGPLSVGQLFDKGVPFSENCWWPETAQGFGKILDSKRVSMEFALDAEITISERATGGKRFVTIKPKTPGGLF
jgi:hypothetical protein